jgi:hypothetical protein
MSKKVVKNTQLTDVMEFSSDINTMKQQIKNRLIMEAVKSQIPGSTLSFYRLMLSIKNPDNSVGDLIIDLDRSYSFGVSESRDLATNNLNGYTLSISMYDREGASEKQMRSVQFINCLSDVIKDHLLTEEGKSSVENWDLEAPLLKKVNPLYFKRDKGKIVEGSSPTFYPKLMYYKASKDKNGKEREARIGTKFYLEDEVDENGDSLEVNPLDFLGVRCHVTPAVKFENVYVASKISMQCKVYEANVKAADSGPKRLLKTPMMSMNTISHSSSSSSKCSVVESKEEESVEPELTLPEDDQSSAVAPEPAKEEPKKVKKVVKKKVQGSE